MQADGVDVSVLDLDPTSPSPNQPPPPQAKSKRVTTSAGNDKKADVTPPPASPLKLKDDPNFAKYFKMLAMHLPKMAVVAKMRADGVDSAILDLDPEGPSPNQPFSSAAPQAAVAAAAEVPPVALKDDPRFLKYFKMLKMHLPRIAVENKMRAEGVDPAVLDLNPEKPAPASAAGPSAAGSASQVPEVLLKDDPKFATYFKMLKMHLPKEVVAAKMVAEGVDPSVLELDPLQPTTSRGPAKRTGGGFALPPPPPK